MDYNTSKKSLRIPEYGRNIQKLVEYACSIDDREERNLVAGEIIKIMNQIHSGGKSTTELDQKLWDHLFIISGFKLDVDSPYPKPEPEILDKKPEPLDYPQGKIKYRYYGRTIENMIEKAMEMEEGERKEAFISTVANLMKKSYLLWNRDTVDDDVIMEHLEELSGGKLKLKDADKLRSTGDIMSKTKRKKRSSRHQGGRGRSNRRKHKRN